MAIDKGNIKTSANYDVRAQKPLDGRAVRPAKADLIKKESWSSDGSTVYVYEGMQVYVQDEKKTYYLKDLSKMFASDFSGWELMGTGAAPDIDLSGYATKEDLKTKQDADKLAKVATSGSYSDLSGKPTFATVNGKRIDEGGNIQIEGGGGGSINPAILEDYAPILRDFSDDFNNDFTN